MKYDPQKHHRQSIRLREYDYSNAGLYFITILIKNRQPYFGEVINGKIDLNEIGVICGEFWLKIPELYKKVVLDGFIIMPNHLHGIIGLSNDRVCKGVRKNAPCEEYYSSISPEKLSLSVVIRAFKASLTGWCRKNGYDYFQWHRNYYDHIIRSEKQLNAIRDYIRSNPANWKDDPDNLQM